jgi:cellulose biosynthesis protein BcsQ
MKKIALFNHKGGVGKTTLTVNIADALAKSDKRVLLVDADPQCN